MEPTELDDQLDDVFVLDVREDQEWDAGRIAQAVHIPMGQLNARIDEIPKDTPIVCVCRSGSRSRAVTDALNRADFQAHNLEGGMHAWEDADLPIVDDDGDGGWVA
ncbi:rhodanese-like domain-containing protein [Salsipaludibacter albus]|uniref:rhodanese-like domain-containing protein n=1 Tax=Salsipaludibacter albus TaxID=2849650 RepID=UPI001EE40D34|nr:rhodanese-like domain-containing protein [Salsipaludibacter albus]MBY5160921.1 rhodanese-like domain-containing protein [Salsipaludibacter albus]